MADLIPPTPVPGNVDPGRPVLPLNEDKAKAEEQAKDSAKETNKELEEGLIGDVMRRIQAYLNTVGQHDPRAKQKEKLLDEYYKRYVKEKWLEKAGTALKTIASNAGNFILQLLKFFIIMSLLGPKFLKSMIMWIVNTILMIGKMIGQSLFVLLGDLINTLLDWILSKLGKDGPKWLIDFIKWIRDIKIPEGPMKTFLEWMLALGAALVLFPSIGGPVLTLLGGLSAPILAVIAAIGALIAIFLYANEIVDFFEMTLYDKFMNLSNGGKLLVAALAILMFPLTSLIGMIYVLAKAFSWLKTVGDGGTTGLQKLKKVWDDFWKGSLTESMDKFLANLGISINKWISNIIDSINKWINNIIESVDKFWANLGISINKWGIKTYNSIKDTLSSWWTSISEWFVKFRKGFNDIMSNIVDGITEAIMIILKIIFWPVTLAWLVYKNFDLIKAKVKNWGKLFVKMIIDLFYELKNKVINIINYLIKTITDTFSASTFFNKISDIFANVFTSLQNNPIVISISNLFTYIFKKAESIFQSIADFFVGLANMMSHKTDIFSLASSNLSTSQQGALIRLGETANISSEDVNKAILGNVVTQGHDANQIAMLNQIKKLSKEDNPANLRKLDEVITNLKNLANPPSGSEIIKEITTLRTNK